MTVCRAKQQRNALLFVKGFHTSATRSPVFLVVTAAHLQTFLAISYPRSIPEKMSFMFLNTSFNIFKHSKGRQRGPKSGQGLYEYVPHLRRIIPIYSSKRADSPVESIGVLLPL